MSGKRRDLSFCDKVQLLNNYDKLGKCTQREAALKLNISQPLLNKLLKQRDEILQKVNDPTIEQWVDIDQDLPTFGTVSDAEIVAELSATVNSENDSDNEQETPKPPTSSEIRSALDVIKRALQEHGDDESFQSFYKINYKLGDYMYKTKNVQTKITDFLK